MTKNTNNNGGGKGSATTTNSTKAGSSSDNGKKVANGIQPQSFPLRPMLKHAHTITPGVGGFCKVPRDTIMARPPVRRVSTTEPILPFPAPTEPDESTILTSVRRLKESFANFFDLSPADARRITPDTPTYWDDGIHRKILIEIWDDTYKDVKSGYRGSLDAGLISAEKRMKEHFPALTGGVRPFTVEWITHVLGTSLRPPFSSGKGLSRREILAASAGPRGIWGPF